MKLGFHQFCLLMQEKLELLEDLDKMVSQAGKEKGERLEIPFLESRV